MQKNGQLCHICRGIRWKFVVAPKARCTSTICASNLGTMPGYVHRKKIEWTSCRACGSLLDVGCLGGLPRLVSSGVDESTHIKGDSNLMDIREVYLTCNLERFLPTPNQLFGLVIIHPCLRAASLPKWTVFFQRRCKEFIFSPHRIKCNVAPSCVSMLPS